MRFGLLPNGDEKHALVAVPTRWLDRLMLARMPGRWFDHWIIGRLRVLEEDFRAPPQPDTRHGVVQAERLKPDPHYVPSDPSSIRACWLLWAVGMVAIVGVVVWRLL